MEDRSRSWLGQNAAHIVALWGFAVLQPTLSVISQNVDLFVVRQVDGWTCVIVIVIYALVPPAVLIGLEALAGLVGERPRAWLHLFFVWGLVALFALYTLKKAFPAMGVASIPVAWVIGLAAVVAYSRLAPARSLLTFLSPAPLLFVAYFVLLSPASKLIFPPEPHAPTRAQTNTPVVMLVLDELPLSSMTDARGRIDAKLFPNFARLARDSTWYRRTVAAADQTEQAIPAILTGVRPRHGEVAVLRDHPDNVFTLLANSHRQEAMEHITWLCPSSVCQSDTPTPRRMADLLSALSFIYAHAVAPAGVADPVGVLGATWQESRDGADPKQRIDPRDASTGTLARHGDAQFERFLESIQPDASRGRPGFYFLHSSLPHVPWVFTPSGHAYIGNFQRVPGLVDGGNAWGPDASLVGHGYRRHLLQARYTDLLLGRLLRHLKRVRLYDRSLLVVTADHGASFVAGGSRRPVERSNVADVGLVPFFVREPGQSRRKVVDAHLQTTDVLPTMADALGVKVPWRTDGRPASQLAGSGRGRVQVTRHTGGAVGVTTSLVERQYRQTARRKEAIFGAGTGLAGVYGRGPDRDLMGRAVPDERAEKGSPWAHVDGAQEFDSVDPRSRFVPALIGGQVERGVERVVISINGRVRGVAPTHTDQGQVRFLTIVPEESFKPGANRVTVFEARGTGKQRRLTPLANAG